MHQDLITRQNTNLNLLFSFTELIHVFEDHLPTKSNPYPISIVTVNKIFYGEVLFGVLSSNFSYIFFIIYGVIYFIMYITVYY